MPAEASPVKGPPLPALAACADLALCALWHWCMDCAVGTVWCSTLAFRALSMSTVVARPLVLGLQTCIRGFQAWTATE